MRKQFILIVLVVLSALSVVAFVFNQPDDEQIIMAATLSITMFAPESDLPGETSYIASDGLATLVADGGARFIVTHDHWSLLDRDRGFVQFSNTAGELLLDIELDAFRSLIRYRDGGTTILTAPAGLESLRPAALAGVDGSQRLKTGDTMLVVHRDNSSLTIVEAGLQKTGDKQGLATVRLQSLHGEVIIGGDSGGGVWLNGKLAGNMWTTIVMEDISTRAQRATPSSIAALYPHPAPAQIW